VIRPFPPVSYATDGNPILNRSSALAVGSSLRLTKNGSAVALADPRVTDWRAVAKYMGKTLPSMLRDSGDDWFMLRETSTDKCVGVHEDREVLHQLPGQ